MLSKKSKYAINSLVYLARVYPQAPVLISSIATHEHIPRKFLEGILLQLKNAGILGSKKGKSGGYFLNRSPEEINVAEVIRLFEGAIALLPCVSYKQYQHCEECEDESVCGIKDLFAEARIEAVKLLKSGTLADILNREARLKAEKLERNASSAPTEEPSQGN